MIITDSIDLAMSRKFSNWIESLFNPPPWENYSFTLNTAGGNIAAAKDMAKTLKAAQKCLPPITCHVRRAWSAGMIVLCASPKKQTICYPDSSLMVHTAHEDNYALSEADRIETHFGLATMLASRSKGNTRDYFRMIENPTAEHYLRGPEIVEEGFAKTMLPLPNDSITYRNSEREKNMPWKSKPSPAPRTNGGSTPRGKRKTRDSVQVGETYTTGRYRVGNAVTELYSGNNLQEAMAKTKQTVGNPHLAVGLDMQVRTKHGCFEDCDEYSWERLASTSTFEGPAPWLMK